MKTARFLMFSLSFAMLTISQVCHGQKVKNVTGKYVYVVSDNDNVTLKEAKRKCIELAKAEAIKRAFGEMVTSDVIDTQSTTNGESSRSYYWENTVAMAKGEWLSDSEAPVLDIRYADGKLFFTAEVAGRAREIVQAQTELHWATLRNSDGNMTETTEFSNNDRLCLQFQSPADGYLAAYLISGDDNTSCLLPYPKDSDGKFPVKAGHAYTLFDKVYDSSAYHYKLRTIHPQEENQIVLIFSPNPFVKCNETSRDNRHPGSLSTHDFQRWLLRCQRQDPDMVVDKKWIRISSPLK